MSHIRLKKSRLFRKNKWHTLNLNPHLLKKREECLSLSTHQILEKNVILLVQKTTFSMLRINFFSIVRILYNSMAALKFQPPVETQLCLRSPLQLKIISIPMVMTSKLSLRKLLLQTRLLDSTSTMNFPKL